MTSSVSRSVRAMPKVFSAFFISCVEMMPAGNGSTSTRCKEGDHNRAMRLQWRRCLHARAEGGNRERRSKSSITASVSHRPVKATDRTARSRAGRYTHHSSLLKLPLLKAAWHRCTVIAPSPSRSKRRNASRISSSGSFEPRSRIACAANADEVALNRVAPCRRVWLGACTKDERLCSQLGKAWHSPGSCEFP